MLLRPLHDLDLTATMLILPAHQGSEHVVKHTKKHSLPAHCRCIGTVQAQVIFGRLEQAHCSKHARHTILTSNA